MIEERGIICGYCGRDEAYLARNRYGEEFIRCPLCGAIAYKGERAKLTDEEAAELWERSKENERA